MSHQRSPREKGAVAIAVAIMAVMLFSVAALAVDLGNAWSRKRDVQKGVDVSAIGAGWMLPMTSANEETIADKVAEYLTDSDNIAIDQDTVTGDLLLDGLPQNGEIYWQHNDGSTCDTNCNRMKVLAPPAQVSFGLASVMNLTSTKVQRSATVLIVSELPSKKKTLPFWFPSNCGLGPSESDTGNGNGNGNGNEDPTPTPTPTATSTATATAPAGPFTPPGNETANHLIGNSTSPYAVFEGGTLSISGLTVTDVPNNTDRVSLRFYMPGSSTYLEKAALTTGIGSTISLPPVTIGTEVTGTVGAWQVFAMVEKNNRTTFSENRLVVNVNPISTASPTPTTPSASATDIPVGCVGSDKGNFGQLDAPRLTGGTRSARLGLNIALGLDHSLVPYVPVSGGPQNPSICEPGGTLIPGGQLDSTSRPGNNCIVGDTGDDGPKMYDGMVAGTDGHPGRLDAAQNGGTSPLCTAQGFSNVDAPGNSPVIINNDRLSCFLRNGATLAQLAQTSGVTQAMLDPSVVKSPRFVWLPVVFSNDRAQHGYQPIKQFVPGFITDETQTTPATDENGLEVGGMSLNVIHVFTFNRDALPLTETSDTTDYDPEMGGAIVRLVQ